MTRILRCFSPESSSGSFTYSILAHVALYGAVVLILGSNFLAKTEAPKEEYLDLGYQTFDEPPPPVQEERRVVRSPEPQAPVETKAVENNAPQELQDEKGEVAGTQAAPKAEANLGNDTNGTAASTPYYKIKPKYPKAALASGTEGWVLMNVDINESGEVENVRIVDGEQRNMFQSEARRAVEKWKYKPFVDGSGKPFRKVDHQVRVDFKLTEAASTEM